MPYKDRETQLQYQRDHYRTNLDDYRNRGTVAARRNRQILKEAKDKPCVDCGVQYPFYVMQLDHLRDKKFCPSDAGARSVKNLLAEIAKCEVVCANCHAERTYQRSHSGLEKSVSRLAHNQEIAGAEPAPATKALAG